MRAPSAAPSEAFRTATTGPPAERRFGPAKADRDPPGLVGDGERIERRGLELTLNRGAEVGCRTHLALEAACEDVALDRLVD